MSIAILGTYSYIQDISLCTHILAKFIDASEVRFFVPSLNGSLNVWNWYVDDTFAIVKQNSIDAVLDTLNRFDRNITLTHKI